GRGLRLGEEPLGARPPAAALEEDLDGAETSELGIARQEDGAHAALAQLADDLVVLEVSADRDRRFCEGSAVIARPGRCLPEQGRRLVVRCALAERTAVLILGHPPNVSPRTVRLIDRALDGLDSGETSSVSSPRRH